MQINLYFLAAQGSFSMQVSPLQSSVLKTLATSSPWILAPSQLKEGGSRAPLGFSCPGPWQGRPLTAISKLEQSSVSPHLFLFFSLYLILLSWKFCIFCLFVCFFVSFRWEGKKILHFAQKSLVKFWSRRILCGWLIRDLRVIESMLLELKFCLGIRELVLHSFALEVGFSNTSGQGYFIVSIWFYKLELKQLNSADMLTSFKM